MDIPGDTRQKMVLQIFNSIRPTVVQTGRTDTDVQKYACNIEQTAVRQCNGNRVRRSA